MTIYFKPKRPVINRVLILGHFNEWLPELMESYSQDQILSDTSKRGVYFYKVKLLVGFKYRYYFNVNDEDEYCVDET